MTLAIDRPQVSATVETQQYEEILLLNLREGDHIDYDGKEWEVAEITKQKWSWASESGIYNTMIWGTKFTVHLFPVDFKFTAQQPKSKDKGEWDIYWRQWQADQDRHRSLRSKIESHGTFQVKRVIDPAPSGVEIRRASDCANLEF